MLTLGIIIALLHPAVAISCTEFHNGDNYTAYEAMLLEDKSNFEELELKFFPTNYRSSIVVDVEYHFIFSDSRTEAERQGVRDEQLNITGAEISHYHFRWVESPINLFIRPGLLNRFSLNTYQARPVSIDLYLGLPFNCSPEILNRILNSSASTCDDPPAHLKKLNILTANVSFS